MLNISVGVRANALYVMGLAGSIFEGMFHDIFKHKYLIRLSLQFTSQKKCLTSRYAVFFVVNVHPQILSHECLVTEQTPF
jgi:hypothetical protein